MADGLDQGGQPDREEKACTARKGTDPHAIAHARTVHSMFISKDYRNQIPSGSLFKGLDLGICF